jgi:hypothetical protein
MKKFLSLILFVSTLVLISSCKTATSPQDNSATTLTAFKLASDADAPNINSSTIEPCWNTAALLTLNPDKIGANFSGSNTSQISIQSVISSSDIYFLVQYDDPEENYLESPVHFKGGDPTDSKNWFVDNTKHQDGVSLIFENIPGTTGSMSFSSNGCAMLCHAAQKNFGGGLIVEPGMYSENEGRYDLWYWQAGKSNGSGYADDEISIGVPNYQLQLDIQSEDLFGYNLNKDFTGVLPFYVAGGSNRSLDKRYFIAEESEQAFGATNPASAKAWATDDLVPSSTLSLPTNPSDDNFNVKARGYWSAGKWTVKFVRKLSNGNTDSDVQFANGNSYLFSFAVHNNNALGNHFGPANKSFKLNIP